MNREIKFRAWEPLNKKMHKLDLALYEFDENDINTHKFVLPPNRQGIQNPYAMMNLEAVKVMQFTGLHDKNGVPIYEGDLVSYYKEELSIVKFIFGSFIVEGLETGHRESFYNLNGLAEVIGNIYVNENLLKQKDGK